MTPNDEANKEGEVEQREDLTISAGPPLGAGTGSFLSIGSLVDGKYRLMEGIGEGGMGVVYKVEQVLLNRQMALKTLTGNEFSESSIRRFQAEAKLLAKLDHPGLVKVQDFGFIDNVKPFLVMDFVQGRTLSSVLKSSGVMSLDAAIKIFVELCFALGYAHSKNIVHRDIKPSNIMLTTPGLDSENEHVKVLDFGIAKLLHRGLNETDSLTRTGEIFGSPFYMSPEQCHGRPVDHRSDIYSMGCVMFEVLTGAPPFAGETSISTIMMHQSQKPLTLKEASMGREFPPEIEKLVASMLEKDPNNRVQSLLDVAQLLIGVQKGLSGGTILPRPMSAPNHDSKHSKSGDHLHTKFVGYAICVLLLGVMGMLGVLYFNQQSAKGPLSADPDLPYTSWTKMSEDGRYKVFTFPHDYSLGTLGYGPVAKLKVAARGEVKIPATETLVFIPNNAFLSHPQFLRNFLPNDLTYIDFKESGVTDSKLDQYKVTARARLRDEELIYCKYLTGLSGLGLKNCKVTDAGMEYIKDLPLSDLNLDGTEVTSAGLKKLRNLHKLVFLRACNLQDGGEILKALAGSTRMTYLAVTATNLKDEDLKPLSTMPNLESVNLSYNPGITDKGLKYIEQMKNVKSIAIELTSVTADAALKSFKKMNLKYRPRVSSRLWTQKQIQDLETTWPQR